MLLHSFRFLTLLLALAFSLPASAQTRQAWYPIKGEDGTAVMNHRVPVELESQVEMLPGAIVVGNPKGDVTIAEFYDLNCPFCRRAAADLAAMIKSDRELRVILVPFAVLSPASVQAARVELAAARMLEPARFYDFHLRLYAGRGTIDGARALSVAKEFGLDEKRIIAVADADAITETMKSHLRLGNALGLSATPSYVVKGAAILGHPGRASLQRIVQSIRKCDKIVC